MANIASPPSARHGHGDDPAYGAHGHGYCDHDHGAPAQRLAAAEALCARRGARLTGPRRAVLEALLSAHRAVGAYDLIETVSAKAGKRAAPITIYRALDFLVEAGLVHRIESRNAFLACPSGHGGQDGQAHAQAAFLICEACGAVGEAMSPALEGALAALAETAGFALSARVIELTGRCAACAAGPNFKAGA